jgi:hypothetical protein
MANLFLESRDLGGILVSRDLQILDYPTKYVCFDLGFKSDNLLFV